MSKNQSQTYLKYGQGILIQGCKTLGDGLGFLTAKGFADSQAKYQTFNKILYFKNYRNSIFQIIPAGNFQINDQLRKIQQNTSQQTPNVKILKARAKSQQTQFELKIKASQKALITFGSDVIFKHVDSDTYLSGTIRPSSGTNGAFSVEVTKNLSEALIFTLMPFRSFERTNEPIRMDSPILIRNKYNNGYLTFEKVGFENFGPKKRNFSIYEEIDLDKKPIVADDTFRIPVKTNSSQSLIYNTVTHFVDLSAQKMQVPMPWQFLLHASQVQNDYLLQHDIVYFQHTANGGVLSTSGTDIVLKELKGQNTSELKFYQCLWEIQKYQEKGEHAYILRHLISGMTLGIEKVKEEGQENLVAKQPILVDISEGESQCALENGYIELRLAKKLGGQINSDSFINIAWGEAFLDIKKNEGGNEGNLDDDSLDQLFPRSKLRQMALAEEQYEIRQLEFTMDISKHCFVIQQIDDNLKKKVLFALSFHSKIIDLREDLKWGPDQAQNKVSYLRMMQVTEKIKQIKQFLKDCSPEQADLEYIHPLQMQQNICKDLGISELLFQLLFYMKQNLKVTQQQPKAIFSQKKYHNQKQKFIELYNSIYEVVTELIRDNKMFKIHISKWIMFILNDVIKGIIQIKKGDDLKQRDVIKQTQKFLNLMKELLNNNQFIVNNFVSETLIQFLSSQMIDTQKHYIFRQIKYLQIFRKFCIVGGNVNSQNQIKILNHFIRELRNKPNGQYYQISLSKKDSTVFTEAAIDKNVPKKRKFADYYKICIEQYPTAWNYFVQYLNLIADMTKGRNKTVQIFIQTMMTLDVLTELFQNEKLAEAQVPIIRLLHYLYAQSEKFYPIERKNRIVNYEKLSNEQITVMCTTSEIKPWNPPLNRIFRVLLEKLKRFGPIYPAQMAQNINLYHILDFVWQTLNLGFWATKQQIIGILGDILRILHPYPGIKYSEVKIESKQNMLMVQCKLQCMKIIQLILDYDVDLAVRYFCQHFQNFKVPPRVKKNVEVNNLMDQKVDKELAQQFIQTFPSSIEGLVKTNIVSQIIKVPFLREPNKSQKELEQDTQKQIVADPSIAKVTKIFSQKDSNIIQKFVVTTDLIAQMIQLSNYNNPSLTSQSISVIQRVLLFKMKSLENFYGQIFVCDGQRKKLVEYIEDKKRKFFTLQNQTLVNVSLRNQEGNYVVIYKDDKQSGIMQDLFMISELIRYENKIAEIKSLPTLDSSKTFSQLGTSKLINFTSQRTSSDIMKQKVLDAENIHLKVLQFILNCRQIPTEQLAKKLLHLCYKFLIGLVWNYQNIKLQMIAYVPSIFYHITKNVGCIDFLKQIYDNNKKMLYNEAEITRLIKQICLVMDKEPCESYYKSKLLDFFRFLIYCNGKSLKFNQIQILKIMQDDSYKNIILKVDEKQIRLLVDRYIEMNKPKDDKLEKYIKMEPKLVYYSTYFQILESLIDDNNKVNMGKLLKKFPFEFLVKLIKQARICWPLKRNIRAFLNRLYYFQPQIETYMKTIINEQVGNIIQDLNYYIQLKCKANVQEYEAQIFENPVRFTYIQSYLYLNLEQNLFTLYELTTRKPIEQQMNNFLHSLNNTNNDGPYNFIRICERLGFIKNYFIDKKNVYSNSFIKFLLSKFKKIIQEFDDSVYMEGMKAGSTNKNRGPSKSEKEEARVKIIEKIMQGEISSFYVQASGEYDKILPLVYQLPDKILSHQKEDKPINKIKLIKKLRQILKKQKREFKTLDEQANYKMNLIVTAIKLSPKAQLTLMQDYNKKLEPYSSQESIFNYITIIIDMNSRSPEGLPQSEKKFFLQLITGIVEQNNKTIMEEGKQIDEWQSDDWRQYRTKIQRIQIKLKSCGLGKFIIQLLKENIYDNIQFANAILLCGISYMLGGNTFTQKNIIEEMQRDDLNKVMKNIDVLISKLGKFILKNIDDGNSKQDLQNIFSTTTIDNYDFYDVNKKYVLRKNVFEPITTDEQIYYKKCVITYRRAFKFLQLLCENNNIQGKNWIRHQPDKVRQANFINVAAKELRNLFQVMNKQIVSVPMFLLDFLLQVTQIPVKQNQQALMSLTFFEDLCAMETFFAKKDEKQNLINISKRGFQNCMDLLNNIYFKSIEIILSNFEGNDKKTFQAIDAKLQTTFLTNILRRKLEQMEIKTKQNLEEYTDKQVDIIFKDDMVAILNIARIFLKLNQKINTDGQNDKSRIYNSYLKMKSQSPALFTYLESLLINIEIKDQYGKLQKVLFPKHPVFNSLSGNLRDFVMENVERGSHRDKIVSLLGYVGGVGDKIEKSYVLEKKQNISEKNMKNSFFFSAVMSFVLCIYMMNFYNVIIEFAEAQYTSSRLIGLGRFFLGLIQLSMTCVYAYYWFRLKIWQKPIKRTRDSAQTSNQQDDHETETKDQSAPPNQIALLLQKVTSYGSVIALKEKWNSLKSQLGLSGDQGQSNILKSVDFWRLFLYFLVSFLGTFFWPQLFFIHIIDIFCNIPELGDIFVAIALSIKSIAYVSALGIAFVFIFCTVTFSNYMKDVYTDSDSSEMCESMFDCLMQLFVSGVIGEAMSQFEIMRFTYDMVYITFFGLLFGNIVSGIMLDAFGSLRNKNESVSSDKRNFCYICNISREALEKQGIDFNLHIKDLHFLWNYVFYIYSLEKKPPTDYTGLEYYISTRYNRPDEQVDVDWVPSGDEVEFNSAEKLKELIQKVDEQNNKILQNLQTLEDKINQFNQIAADYL